MCFLFTSKVVTFIAIKKYMINYHWDFSGYFIGPRTLLLSVLLTAVFWCANKKDTPVT